MPRVGSSGLTKNKSHSSFEFCQHCVGTVSRRHSPNDVPTLKYKTFMPGARYLVTRMVDTARQIMHLA